jgi:hypothetical protein
VAAGAALLACCVGAPAPAAGGARQAIGGVVRVDQVGYAWSWAAGVSR